MPQSPGGKSMTDLDVLDPEPNQVIYQIKKASVKSPNYIPSQIHSPHYTEARNDQQELG